MAIKLKAGTRNGLEQFGNAWGREVAEEYNKTAELFARWEPSRIFRSVFERSVLEFIKNVQGRKRINVLDAGCGHGTWIEITLDFCEKEGIKNVFVDGVDFSEKRIEIAKKRLRGFNNVSLYCDDLLKFKPPRKYDLIYCLEVLQGIPEANYEHLLKAWSDSLSKKGELVVVDRDKFSTYSIVYAIQCKLGKLRKLLGPFNLIDNEYLGIIEHISYPSFGYLVDICRKSKLSNVRVLKHKWFRGLIAEKIM